MLRAPRHQKLKRLDTILFAAAALGLLTMPVEYRAGAEVPHYHIFFQLWIDASNPSFRHHEPERDHATAHLPANLSTADRSATVSDEPDAPSLSAITAPETRWAILVVLGGLLMAAVAGRPATAAVVARSLKGRAPQPEPPPPRLTPWSFALPLS